MTNECEHINTDTVTVTSDSGFNDQDESEAVVCLDCEEIQ